MDTDQEHVFIKLFYPASVGQVTESDLDQILTDIKKNETLWPVVCTMVAPVTLRSSHPQSASTGASGSTNSVPTEAVSEIYCKTLSSTVGCSGTSTDSGPPASSILLELMCNFTDKTIVDQIVSALKITVTKNLVNDRGLPSDTGVYILKMPLN